MMNSQIETIRKNRSRLLEQLAGLNTAQFNETPDGFSNNIAWNLGHLVVVQQGVCYKKAGLPTRISDDFWRKFAPGSKPGGVIGADEIDYVKELLFITLDQLEVDYNKQIFNNYTAWTTRLGDKLNCIDDGLKFLEFHEDLHTRAIIVIKTLVVNHC
jgi:hypothetical protein